MRNNEDNHHADASHLVWESMGGETLLDAKIFRLRSISRRSHDGRIAPFISLDSPDWVTIIPELPGVGVLAEDGSSNETRFLMVRQFRHGSEKVGLEFPAGVIDSGESPRDAAIRELQEETGYRADELVEIGAVNPNPAFMNNTTYTYLARGLEKISGQNLDENEILDFHEVGMEEIRKNVGSGVYANAIVVQAWYFYLRAVGKV